MSLSAAQLAVAREYGFPSWPSVRTEAEYRRGMSAARPGDRTGAERAEDRWPFGGATAVQTAAGTAPACGWLELRGRDGAATRLVPSARPRVRVGPVAPASERESARPAESRIDMHPAASRTGDPRQHLSLTPDLPSVNGTEVRLDSLVFEPGGWRLYLRARPSWWDYGPDATLRGKPCRCMPRTTWAEST